ncbi:pseudouridine synthase [Microdochium trichocladiopsis]|uniref:Pseudouridine synthase n=1 Tax=Microdochium trichocladiopsis TaxID=1682393 RepID=A0A9P8YHB2_9PEZI|nr:pseudouridine synthase [Microdochium trichocladiopsis]KAH7037943.1 pseudouridine synthase [Microdochium trichocladiopsis]
MATHTAMAQGGDASLRDTLEQRIGITHFVSTREHSWNGSIRTRYTDFQVNEINKAGEVVHLKEFYTNAKDFARAESSRLEPQDNSVSQPADAQAQSATQTETVKNGEPNSDSKSTSESKVEEAKESVDGPTDSDRTLLAELVGADTAQELSGLYDKILQDPKAKAQSHGSVQIPAIEDKGTRSRIHTEIRRIFAGKIDTSTGSENTIKAAASGGKGQRRPDNDRMRGPRQDGGQPKGKFLHFSLYKENRETMDAVGQLARVLNLKNKDFGTAGTKDRRAVTVQRVSIKGRNPSSLVFINNNRIPGVKIGDFKYEEYPLRLGSHGGNEFVIVLKNCVFDGTEGMSFDEILDVARTTTEAALKATEQRGFLNYFGTQRFGTHEIGTQDIGIKILKEDFEGAVKSLLAYDASLLDAPEQKEGEWTRNDDIMRAKACAEFLTTGNVQAAVKLLPRRCQAEYNMMRHLEKQPKDYIGAIQSINRGMRTMYVHAYQSLVWNFAASKRWELFGDRVVKGDLVIEQQPAVATAAKVEPDEIDEENIHLQGTNEASEAAQDFERARPLTEEEASSGKYSIFDIVLPTPGFDIVYPDNDIGQFYVDFMAKEENGALDPHNMRRRHRDFSLPGSYRKVMGNFIKTPSISVQTYTDDLEQLVPTDLDLILQQQGKPKTEQRVAYPRGERRKAEDAVQEDEPSSKKAKTAEPAMKNLQENGPASTEGPESATEPKEALAVRPPPGATSSTEEKDKKIAVILRIALDTSQYATMAIRELQGRYRGTSKVAE